MQTTVAVGFILLLVTGQLGFASTACREFMAAPQTCAFFGSTMCHSQDDTEKKDTTCQSRCLLIPNGAPAVVKKAPDSNPIGPEAYVDLKLPRLITHALVESGNASVSVTTASPSPVSTYLLNVSLLI